MRARNHCSGTSFAACFLLLLAYISSSSAVSEKKLLELQKKVLNINNASGRRIEIFYVNEEKLHLMVKNPLDAGVVFNANTYMGHNFEVREVPEKRTGECGGVDMECRSALVTIGDGAFQNYILGTDFTLSVGPDIPHIPIPESAGAGAPLSRPDDEEEEEDEDEEEEEEEEEASY